MRQRAVIGSVIASGGPNHWDGPEARQFPTRSVTAGHSHNVLGDQPYTSAREVGDLSIQFWW